MCCFFERAFLVLTYYVLPGAGAVRLRDTPSSFYDCQGLAGETGA